MIERVIENWLTSSNERQYQIPFCQLLNAEGETVVYISPHGQREQGKDVVSLVASGPPRAYQLKCGRITLASWRNIKGEINELVEYPIDDPGVSARRDHTSFLVTNGTVADTVLSAIQAANNSWRRRKFRPLQLITGPALLARFVKMHGRYFPTEPRDLNLFLELVLDGGKGPLDKDKLSRFFETVLPLGLSRPRRHRDVQRSIASAALLCSYIL